MSQSDIIRLLKAGPKTAKQMALRTHRTTADVSRICSELRYRGKVCRIDNGSGKGSIATYALVDPSIEIPSTRPRHAERTLAEARQDADGLAESLRVERDPCFLCGVRADIGCYHRRAF